MISWLKELLILMFLLILVDLLKKKKQKKTDDDSKINEIKRKMSSITGLATTAALNDFKNNIPNLGDLVKKRIIIQYQKILRGTSDTNKFMNGILHTKI